MGRREHIFAQQDTHGGERTSKGSSTAKTTATTKAKAGPSIPLFAKCANNLAQDDTSGGTKKNE